LINRWNKFWFEEKSRESLCLLRIFFGTIFFFKLTGFHNLQNIEEMGFRFPKHNFSILRNFYFDGFRNPLPGLDWLPVPDFYQYQFIEELLLVASVFFVIGLFTRFFGIFISLTYTYFFLLSQFSYYHHKFQFITVLLILGFSTCNQYYSIDSLIFKKDRKKRKILPIRLVQVFLTIVYGFSFIQKLNYPWISGDIMLMFLDQGSIKGNFHDIVISVLPGGLISELFWRSLGPFTLFAEGLLTFGLWIPRLRRFTLLIGVLLHTGIDLTMAVSSFSFQMMASYIVFICPESYQNRVFYDGNKIKHRLVVLFGKLFDWLQRIRWIKYSSDEFNRTGFENSGKLKFAGQGRRPSGGIHFIYGVMSMFPLTFVFSFIPGLYLFIKNVFFRLKKPV